MVIVEEEVDNGSMTFFPNLDEDPTWHVASSKVRDDEGNPLVTPEGIPFEFVTYTRE